MNQCGIEERQIRDWLDQNWLDIVNSNRRVVDFPVKEWGESAAGYIGRHFGIEPISPECVKLVTKVVEEFRNETEFFYDHELRRKVRGGYTSNEYWEACKKLLDAK